MMEGITVLSQIKPIEIYFAWFILGIIGICIFGLGLWTIEKGNCFIAGAIIAITGMSITVLSCAKGRLNDTIYKVTISDEVNFVEFNNKYEIIDQDGLIYTIREKEINNE